MIRVLIRSFQGTSYIGVTDLGQSFVTKGDPQTVDNQLQEIATGFMNLENNNRLTTEEGGYLITE